MSQLYRFSYTKVKKGRFTQDHLSHTSAEYRQLSRSFNLPPLSRSSNRLLPARVTFQDARRRCAGLEPSKVASEGVEVGLAVRGGGLAGSGRSGGGIVLLCMIEGQHGLGAKQSEAGFGNSPERERACRVDGWCSRGSRPCRLRRQREGTWRSGRGGGIRGSNRWGR